MDVCSKTWAKVGLELKVDTVLVVLSSFRIGIVSVVRNHTISPAPPSAEILPAHRESLAEGHW